MLARCKMYYFALLLPAIAVFASCNKKDSNLIVPPTDTTNKLGIIVPNNFNYETVATTALDVSLLSNDNKPLKGILVNFLDKPAESGGLSLYTALTDENGKISASINLPSYLSSVVVEPSYVGLMQNASVKVVSNKVLCTIGGSLGYQGNALTNGRVAASTNRGFVTGRTAESKFIYMGKYNESGRPEYLEPEDDKISEQTLSYINASLPEQHAVADVHPEYLKESVSTNLDILEPAEVWITFVHEGAGFQNTLAFFTYPTGKQPTSTEQIEALTIILPNTSLRGSGGDLVSGNKVNIGKYEAGTSIGFCLIAQGWSWEKHAVQEGDFKYFSIDALNPESEGNKRHVVLLKDDANKLVLAGFEDQNRDKASDNDFNDLVFYATSNPLTAIDTDDFPHVDDENDSDGDGVPDIKDKFPKDPLRAYIVNYPRGNRFASIAFEDTWPNTGDYDLNDLVVDYHYSMIRDAKNRTVELYATYVPRASGASFRNGFGVQFPFAPSLVKSVTGSRVTDKSVVSINSNGCESDQKRAVIIPFDDIYLVMKGNEKTYINTQPGVPYIKTDTIQMQVTFTTTLSAEQLGRAPFNQFAISNKTRGKEIHLPGELPTDKVNTALFNTVEDNTIPSENRYYKTRKNLPFAISITESFAYPYEGKMITDTYLKFVDWAQSGGASSPDWYFASPGYRNDGFIYK